MRWSTASLLALVSLSADAFVPLASNNLATLKSATLPNPRSAPLFVETADEAVNETEDAVAAPAAVEEEAPAASDDEEKRTVARDRYTIFVGNLPFDLTEASIKELFDAYGQVDLVSLPRQRETGQPRGFAFVDMSTEEEMNAAIDAMEGQMVNGRVIRVSQSVPKDQLPPRQKKNDKPEPQDGLKKIYMGNIPFDCTKDEVLEFYSEYGDVAEVYVPLDSDTGNGRGFAFVTMKEEDADKAIEATNGQMFGGRKLVVSVPLPPGKKAPERQVNSNRTKLYIGNLSFYTVRDTLVEIFSEFGTVHDCYLPEDPSTGGSRGFGFVTLDKDVANTAISEIDGCEVDGRMIRVNEAQPKGRRTFNDDDDDDFSDRD